jgi:hypothetical protein
MDTPEVVDNPAEVQHTTSVVDLNVLYKKWHRAGFISVGYWPHADRFFIEIGSLDRSTGKLNSATKCFVPVTQFLAYLHAEVHGTMPIIFPDSFYGGSTVDGRSVSRVFKLAYWTSQGQPDSTARAFKCGHFEGIRTDSGAIKPDLKKMISMDLIKMTLAEIADLYQTLTLAVVAQRTVQMLSLQNDKPSG